MKQLAILLGTLSLVISISACGGSSSSNTTGSTSMVLHRAFITNTYAGALQVVNSQNDTTNYTQQTVNSLGQLVPGVPVSITIGGTPSFAVVSPDRTHTLVYDTTGNDVSFVDNSTEVGGSTIGLPGVSGMAVFSPDSSTAYVPVQTAPTGTGRPGIVDALSVANANVAATYTVPSAKYVALSPSGQYLLVFADSTDSIFLLNLTATPVTTTQIPGFSRPVNAFFSSDSNTAYVLNCGAECGGSSGASVAQLNIPTQTITATVSVGGASVGLMSNGTLYVAGTPVPPGTNGTFDAISLSNLSLMTPSHVAIGDGFHTTMALSMNNKLYIGASSCANISTGCLSIVNVSTNTADPPLPPRGAITGELAITGRNTVYVIEGGYWHIYDTTTDTVVITPIIFTGALYSVVQVDTP